MATPRTQFTAYGNIQSKAVLDAVASAYGMSKSQVIIYGIYELAKRAELDIEALHMSVSK